MGVVQSIMKQAEAVPGDIKSWYIPFMFSKQGPSFYTFKKPSEKQSDGWIPLGICPNSFSQMLKNDIGYGLIGSFDHTKAQTIRTKPIDILTIFDSIPTIKIREIQQDSKMQDITSAMKIISEGFDLGKDVASSLFNNGFAATRNALISKASDVLNALVDPANKESGLKSKYTGNVYDQIILNWPYGLYYNLIGSTTTNIYELPCNYTELRREINANGWEYQDDDSFGFGSIGTSSIIGKVMNFLGSNFSIKLQPRWKASDTSPQTVSINVNLFNDTLNHSIANYIMVNNLMANAMSLQYGLYKHAPAYYDIKISGFTRMFMCRGSIKVSHGGQTRSPNVEFYKILEKYRNKYYKYNQKEFNDNQLIKIPDVYKLELTFDSLLPQNINNYLYQFSKNELKMYENVTQDGYIKNAENEISAFGGTLANEIKKLKANQYKQPVEDNKHNGGNTGTK